MWGQQTGPDNRKDWKGGLRIVAKSSHQMVVCWAAGEAHGVRGLRKGGPEFGRGIGV